ncbi:PDDEXK nuclease domain-containing protein [Halotia branconii]|uniref:PDDEXK nuclease domain-containing protein n=1 Tax=Halotia branconii CENA392 TaxID=1539056 RepID=A0AAJ6NYA4_9CYAN|nr:PDDEXK nuclease domain-containing protein [Halotia branconii]WGV28623.1 PDDEXK nuclease domain-containing protein [Halotia branconii CENA392]
MSNPISNDYRHLLMEIKQRIRSAQYEALKAVNREMINLYWDIGQMIYTRQQEAGWGKSVVEQLAKDLQAEFPGISGFSAANLWRMRLFYESYVNNEKLAPLVREIGWSHNLVIVEKCKDDLKREFYIRMTRKFGWTKNVLIHQIENQTYEKTLLNQTNFNQTVSAEIHNQLKLAVKDEYTFDFLELADEHSERQLEQAILARVEPFLQEMGGRFTFVGSQYRLEVGDEEFFIDLLLYHRQLKCLVAIELETGEFLPEYVGKMQFYLVALDDLSRFPDENFSIGIILCKSKDKTIVEYALRESNKLISIATYKLFSTLPQELKNQLPAPEQVAKLLEGVE